MIFLHWVDQYGYLVLFLALMIELIALGIPTEILMSYVGYLTYQGTLNYPLSIIIGGLGSIIGMTIAYWIGNKLGYPFFHKHGAKIHLGPDRLDKASKAFKKHGKKLILVAYFIPGIRHVTPYFSGITRIPFKSYALYAYIGAYLWVGAFISLGRVLGPQWKDFHGLAKKYIIIGVIILVVILAIAYFIKIKLQVIKIFTIQSLSKTVDLFRSQVRLKLLIVSVGIVFIVFFALMLGLIQDYLNNEFEQFNQVTLVIFQRLFDTHWQQIMTLFTTLSSMPLLMILIITSFIWIAFKGEDRLAESEFAIILFIGGLILKRILATAFHTLHITGGAIHNFPNQQIFFAIVVYGFLMYMLSRYVKRYLIKTLITVTVVVILLLNGIGLIYFGILPNDVVAGYVFGGVWLTLVIVLLEIFRLIRGANK